jgi:chromosome partitioning protein
MKTLAFYNLKGGVGKTTAVVNLSYLAAQEGFRTLLWDLDPQGSATFHFRIKSDLKIKANYLSQNKNYTLRLIKTTNCSHLDLIPANFKIRNLDVVLGDIKKGTKILAKLVKILASRYDYVFFDCPTSLSLLARSIFRSSDYLVMPVIPTTLSLKTFERVQFFLLKHFQEKPELIPFFSMVDQRKNLHRESIEQYSSEKVFCKSFIPTRSIIEKMGVHRAPLPSFSLDSRATEEYKALWQEIKTRIQ